MKKTWPLIALAGLLAVGSLSLVASAQNTPQKTATVNFTDKVQSFTLPDTTGANVTVGDWGQSKATVIMFIATRCPVSKDYDARMARIAKAYEGKGIRFFGINSNQQEPTDEVAQHAKDRGFSFAVLKDLGNKIADRFDAKVTPEVYVINANGMLVYKGQIDDSRNEANITVRPLAAALDALLAGKTPTTKEARAFGCSIKKVN